MGDRLINPDSVRRAVIISPEELGSDGYEKLEDVAKLAVLIAKSGRNIRRKLEAFGVKLEIGSFNGREDPNSGVLVRDGVFEVQNGVRYEEPNRTSDLPVETREIVMRKIETANGERPVVSIAEAKQWLEQLAEKLTNV